MIRFEVSGRVSVSDREVEEYYNEHGDQFVIPAEVTVLDFPSRRRFKAELRRGYDIIGISFILPNFAKARRMAELVREHAPSSKIVLGGHGTAIPGIEKMIEHDHLCRGEGVKWFRELLGEDLIDLGLDEFLVAFLGLLRNRRRMASAPPGQSSRPSKGVPAGTTAQLIVNAAAFMPFRAKNVEPA